MELFDIIVLGGGPAGLSAAVYGGRALLKVAVIEKSIVGGQIILTNEIENYPGVIEEESGASLMQRFEAGARNFGATFIYDSIERIDIDGDIKKIYGANGEYHAKAIVIASGASPRRLRVPGEDDYTGRGVSFCATCDGAFFRGKDVFVVGGGDSAVEEAGYLTRFARRVTVIHRRDALRAAKNIQKKAFANEKIHFLWDTIVTSIVGDHILRELHVENVKTKEKSILKSEIVDDNIGFFIFIGREPSNELFRDVVELDADGFVITDENMQTNIDGVFAAGDIRKKLLRQVVTAAADGAIAAVAASKYIEEKFEE